MDENHNVHRRAIHTNTFAYMDIGTPSYERREQDTCAKTSNTQTTQTTQTTLKKPETVLEHVRKWQHDAKQPVHIFIDDAAAVMLGCRTEHSG